MGSKKKPVDPKSVRVILDDAARAFDDVVLCAHV
jgi:hypothetical protein